MSKNVLFTVDGFEVEDNKVYMLSHKKDADAPTGIAKAGASILPSVGIGRTFSFRCPEGIWDTGFHKASECYRTMDDKEAEKIMKERIQNILKPYQKAVGEVDCLENTNPTSLDVPRFSVEVEKAYHTKNPVHRMDLYAALLTKKVAPKLKEKDPKYRHAVFIVEDITISKKNTDEVQVKFIQAIRKFEKLYESDPETLRAALIWNGIKGFSSSSDLDAMSVVFSKTIQGDPALTERFMNTLEEMESKKSGYLKYFIHEKLVGLRGKSSKFAVGGNGKFYYDGVDVGADIKTASITIALNNDYEGFRQEILSDGKVSANV